MLLLGIDLETGGAFNLPLEKNFITEIGLVLWDTEFGQPVDIVSLLLKPEQPLAPEAVEYTGISDALLQRHGRPVDIRMLQPIATLMKEADHIVAHNGREFDRPLLDALFTHAGLKMPATPWLDTQYDVDYPRNCASRSLIYLAGFHGMVNPFQHRAVTDVLTMFTILARYDIEQVIANSQRKWLVVQANVGYDEREKAKEKGFRWQSDGGRVFEKCWVKRIREDHLPALQSACDFNLTVLERR
jgi:DNA polymerase-3 subunit epsilon